VKFRLGELFSIKTIRGKFFLLATSLTILPMIVLSMVFYHLAVTRIGANAERHAVASLRMAEQYMDQAIIDLYDLTNVILGNPDLQNILRQTDVSDYEYLRNLDQINRIMTNNTQTKPYISSFLIYSVHGAENKQLYRGSVLDSAFFGSQEPISMDRVRTLHEEMKERNTILWVNGSPFGAAVTNPERMTLGKLLRKTTDDYGELGFLLLEIDKPTFFEGLQFINPTVQSQILILDENRQLLYRMPRETEQAIPDGLIGKMDEAGRQTTGFWKWEGNPYVGTAVENERTGWKIVHLLESSILYKDASDIGQISIQLFLSILLIGWAFALKLSDSISSPLRKLRSLMVVHSDTNPPPKDVSFDPMDEVGQIGERYLRIMRENARLHKQVYDSMLQRKEAEIQTLQAQIKPHFLYNTLEALNGFAISKNETEMSQVIGALGKFFRITLSKGKDYITIAEELEHVSAYVTVQQFRFKDKFEWICEVDEAILSYHTPKLILQPLVENAIIHGLQFPKRSGMVMVSGGFCERGIYFQVTDDGVGISEEDLRHIVQSLEDREPGKIYGLKNVHNRLRLSFGPDYGLTLSSEPGKFTTVTVTLPLLGSETGGQRW